MKRKAILLSIFAMFSLVLVAAVGLQPHSAVGQVQEAPTPMPRPADYGDAPDSTNNQGISPNTAYADTSTAGNFPTAYQNTAAGDPAGPIHLNPNMVYLGDGVSGEVGADFGPDQDGPNNIVDNALDNANNDGFDDGWLNPDVPFPHCQRTTLEVRVSRSISATTDANMYLNVWFDGNRNGVWGDQINCPGTDLFPTASEWIVVNDTINLGAIPPGGSQDIVINTRRVPNGDELASHWIRFTLTENPLPAISKDGRGPTPPNGHAFGETEDYLYTPLPTSGEPGSIVITKSFGTASPVLPNETVDVIIDLKNDAGNLPRNGTLIDKLPAGLEYVGPISVSSLGSVSNLTANYDAGRNTIAWNGTLDPGSGVRLSFPAEVGYCFGDNQVITNTAKFIGNGGNEWSDDANLAVNCENVSTDDITIERQIYSYSDVGGNFDRNNNPNYYLPGGRIMIETVVTNNSGSIVEIGVNDKLDYQRPDLSPDPQATNTDQMSDYLAANGGRFIFYSFIDNYVLHNQMGVDFHPSGEIISTVTVCLLDFNDSECSNPAHKIVDTPWLFKVEMSDLGDAPASRNHADIEMEAYPGIVANFPTVYDPSLPGDPGPIITNTQTLHLGRHSSYEVEADVGPDAIFSSVIRKNNIDPASGLANRESSSDDGLISQNLYVPDCFTEVIPLTIYPTDAAVTYFKNQTDSGDAFINVYLDSNQDGDWQDSGVCNISEQYSEHIIVNQPVNIAALYGNREFEFRFLSGNVSWETNGGVSSPRWMRVMITDRPVNLNSHGGGSAIPYNFGEIEDYLIDNDYYPTLVGGELPPVDVGFDIFEPEQSEAPVGFRHSSANDRDYYRFTAEYANLSGTPVTPTLSLALNGTEIEIERITIYNRTNQELVSDQKSPCADPADCDVPLGKIDGREVGKAQVFFSVPAGTAQNDITINGEIVSPNDPNPDNNKAQVTFKPSFLPRPTIEEIGVTNTGNGDYTVVIDGLALPNSNVLAQLQNGDIVTTSVQANSDGHWSAAFNNVKEGRYLANGLLAVNGVSGPPSKQIELIVSDQPVISKFMITDENGQTATIRLGQRVSQFNWGKLLDLPTGDYQIEAKVINPSSEVEIILYNRTLDEIITLSDFDGDGVYSGNLTISAVTQRGLQAADQELLISVRSEQTETIIEAEIGEINGEATITDADSGNPIAGATVTAYHGETGMLNGRSVETFTLWNAQDNPDQTDSSGNYGFIVSPGSYRIQVNAAGYQAYRSVETTDSKGLLSLPLSLTQSISETADASILLDDQISTTGVTIKPGGIVEFINIGNGGHSMTGTGWSSGLLLPNESYKRRFDAVGIYTIETDQDNITVIVTDEDGPSNAKIFLPMAFK